MRLWSSRLNAMPELTNKADEREEHQGDAFPTRVREDANWVGDHGVEPNAIRDTAMTRLKNSGAVRRDVPRPVDRGAVDWMSPSGGPTTWEKVTLCLH